MHRHVGLLKQEMSKAVGFRTYPSIFVNDFLVLFTIQSAIWDSFTKRMFCLDRTWISPEMLCYPVDNVDKSVQNHKNLIKWAVDMWIKNVDNQCGQTGPNGWLDFFCDFFVHVVQCVCLNPQGGGGTR